MHKFSKVAAIVLLGASVSFVQGADVKNIRAKHMDTNSTIGTAQLDLVSVTANRSETDVAKYAGQVSVINQNDLVKSPSIIESIAKIPGVQTGLDYGRQVGQSFNIRGFGYQSEERVIIEQDGIKRSPSLFSNQISSFRVDNDLLKRVEVVKGGSSVLHGSGAIGGIVSMQTKDVDDFINPGDSYGVMIGHRQESNNMNSNRAALAFKPVENFGILFYGKHADFGVMKMAKDGQRGGVKYAINDERINTVFAKAQWDITDEHGLDFSVYNYHENFVSPWQSLFWSEPGFAPTVGQLKQRDYKVEYKYFPMNNPWVNFSVQYYNSSAQNHRIRSATGRRAFVNDYTNKDNRWGVNLKNESFFNTASLEHRLVVGADYEQRKENAIFVADGELLDFGSFPNFYKDLGIYVQDVIDFSRLELTLGGRFDKFKRGVNLEGREPYSESRFSPKIAVAYEIFDGLNLLAGYAETFRGPTPNETSAAGALNPHYYYLPNNSLKPEIAKEFEAGFSIDKENLLGDDRFYLKATYYNGNIKDMIAIKEHPELGAPPFDPNAPSRRYARYENIDNAKRYGYEIESRYDINNLSFNLGYDHTKVYNKETKKRITVYADKLTFGANYLYAPWHLTLGADANYWFKPKRDQWQVVSGGETYIFHNERFMIVNLRGSWMPKNFDSKLLNQGFKISFGVNNIFNKEYMHTREFVDSSRVGKGRNFYIDFEKKF
ncbi:TonB-dependent receptor domain-containing protein [Campylobacter sp.]|uniref:TonB-dependent receptor domain-containing protein n=1 Tax=Campylobacter sp. TaxID=205 RepID=UPI0026F57C52|nr:TonB-dependent receptor [Campylobacter sp.]